MNKEDFLNLNEIDQHKSITELGNLLINFLQGDTSIHFYKYEDLFIKIVTKSGGYRHVEVNRSVPNFRLSEA